MGKLIRSKSRTRRHHSAMSLVELLTCVMIIGIATAGSMELAYVNAFWAANGMNKADNLYAARRFLDVLSRDLRNTAILTQTVNASSVSLTLLRSVDLKSSPSNFDQNGFPTAMTKIYYVVKPDPNSTDMAATDYLIERQEDNSSPVTVLTGLVGPINPNGSPPLAVFQYSDPSNPSNTTDGLSAAPTSQTNSVVINLELKRVSSGSATTAMNDNTTHSFEALRSEIFLRNDVCASSAFSMWSTTP